ncbi:MAG: amino acid ABC transporter permease [Clostridiales bacterium]|nr:amino acid ABC transporter permease [Clostridiales bacterium]
MASFFEGIKSDFITCFLTKNRWHFITDGLVSTLMITFFACIMGIVIGVVIAIVRSTYDKNHKEMRKGVGKNLLAVINAVAKLYLTVIRGTPVLVQLMIMYYIIFASSNNGILVAIMAFGINSGAYVAEIFRSGIMSVDQGQFEAGRSLGFSYIKTMQYIVIPQAFKSVLPALANEFIVLLKETSVAGYVAIQDLTKGGDIIRSATYNTYIPLLTVAAIYLVMVIFFTHLVSRLERRLRSSER